MKTKIQIKSIFGSVLFEFKKENNNIKDTVIEAIKRSANLRSANLSSADLRYADLSYAKTDKRYIQISCIGSRKGMTTYCFEDDIVTCGCFTGTLAEFEVKVNKTHKENAKYLKEYLGAITYIKLLK